jgi:hypothetical protein
MSNQAFVDLRREAMLRRVRSEFREMPGLNLTARQACRLWQINLEDCHQILERLVEEHFLRRTASGSFVQEHHAS